MAVHYSVAWLNTIICQLSFNFVHAASALLLAKIHVFVAVLTAETCLCDCVSTWTRCGSSSTRTCDTCSIHRAFRCTTSRPTQSTSTILMRSTLTRAMTRRTSTDSKHHCYCYKWALLYSAIESEKLQEHLTTEKIKPTTVSHRLRTEVRLTEIERVTE